MIAAGVESALNATSYVDQVNAAFDIPRSWVDLVLGVAGMVLGLMVAVLGSRILRFATFLLGFAVGAALVSLVVLQISGNQTTALIAGAIAGAVVGVLAVCITKVGKAVVGGGVIVLLAILLVQTGLVQKIGNNYVIWAAIGVLLLLVVLLAYKFHHHLFVVATAFGGSCVFTLGKSLLVRPPWRV